MFEFVSSNRSTHVHAEYLNDDFDQGDVLPDSRILDKGQMERLSEVEADNAVPPTGTAPE